MTEPGYLEELRELHETVEPLQEKVEAPQGDLEEVISERDNIVGQYEEVCCVHDIWNILCTGIVHYTGIS